MNRIFISISFMLATALPAHAVASADSTATEITVNRITVKTNTLTSDFLELGLPCRDVARYQLNGDGKSVTKEIDRYIRANENRIPTTRTVRWAEDLVPDLESVIKDVLERNDSLETGTVRQQIEDLIFITVKDESRNLFVVAHGNSIDYGRNVKDIVVENNEQGKDLLEKIRLFIEESQNKTKN